MLANLRALFGVFVDILLLRRGPEHLPASVPLLGSIVMVYVVLYGVTYRAFVIPQLPEPPENWPLQLGVGTLITLLWFRVALQLVRKSERYVQTMTAMFAVNTLFIGSVPLVAALMPYMNRKSTEPPVALMFLLTALVVWVIAVLSRIVRSAFEWSWPAAVLFVLASYFGGAILLSIIFGTPQKAA